MSKIFHLPIIDSKSIVDFGKKLAGIKTDEEKEKEKENNQNENDNKNSNDNNANENNDNNNLEEKENKNNNVNNNENEFNRKNSIEKDLIHDIQKTIKELDEGRAEAEEAYNKRPNKKKNRPTF